MFDWMTAAAVSLTLMQSQTPPAPQPAQTPAAQSPTALEDVVVEGRRLRAVVQNFVGEISAPAGNRGPARWNGPVCIGVVNLRTDVAQYIVDRTSDVARGLGLNAGEPGCSPNVLIVAAADGRGTANAIVDARRRAFQPGGSGMARSAAALDRFRTSDAPIRWWHVSVPVDSDTGEWATRLPGEPAPVINVSRASRLRTDIRDDLLKAIIVVDMDQVTGLNFTQLADYLALVSLSQVDPEADVGAFDTVLNVFTDPATPGLTSWDMDYLHALYSAEQNTIGANARGAEIVDLMLNGPRTAEPAPDQR